MKKILYVDHAPYEGGAEVSLKELIRVLDRSQFSPILVAPKDAPYARELAAQDVLHIPMSFHWLHYHLGYPLVQDVLRLVRIIHQISPDIVHFNTRVSNLVGGSISFLHGIDPTLASVRFINHVRDKDPLPQWKFKLLGRVDELIANSKQVRDFLVDGGISTDRISVIYNGVDLSKYEPSLYTRTIHHRTVVTFIGQLYPRKGLTYLLEALHQLKADHPKVLLRIAGQDPTPTQSNIKQYRKFVEELELTEHVEWLGYRNDIPQLLAETDLFVLPALEEPFGRVVIEAMAMNVPVVATSVGGIPEIIEDGVSGLLTKPTNVDELVAAMQRLLTDASFSNNIKIAGRKRVLDHFSLAEHVVSMQNLYNRG